MRAIAEGDLSRLVEDPHEGDDHQVAAGRFAGISEGIDQGDLEDGPVFSEGFQFRVANKDLKSRIKIVSRLVR